MSALSKKIKAMKDAKIKAELAKQDALADNEAYVDYLADLEIESDIITKLDKTITLLNGIKAITTNDGTTYKVNIFPVAENIFGPVTARVLGIVRGAGAMFTDERQKEFTAITGMPHLMAMKAQVTIGNPAYFNKGEIVQATLVGDYETPVSAVFNELEIPASLNKVDDDTLAKWFQTEARKASAKLSAFKKEEALDTSKFTLED